MITKLYFFVFLNILACGGGRGSNPPTNSPTPSAKNTPSEDLLCLEGTFLSYGTFAQDFFQHYCLMCHSSARTENDRYGAKVGMDFDSYELIAQYNEEILSSVTGDSATMPPAQTINTTDLRLIEEWLTCGFPP